MTTSRVLEALERRRAWLRDRTRGRPHLTYDRAELRALTVAIAALRAADAREELGALVEEGLGWDSRTNEGGTEMPPSSTSYPFVPTKENREPRT